MKFKEGDKVQFIREGSLIDGVVKEFKGCSPDMWYLIDDKCKDSWIFGGHLILLTPLPIIPQFVADAIDTFKDEGDSLAVAIDYEVYTNELVKELSLDSRVRGWLWETSNQELFARAWMGEYEVEQEPLYYVRLPIVRLNTLGTAVEGDYKYLWADQATGENNIFQSLEYPATLIQSGWETKFTEQEIKELDERYWSFAVPVEEVEETK
ncbi:hypothetical protein C9795_06660 [Listeria monocytogenes]|uniref:DUF1642 domain-containing protein n=1 Tax=Listeria monocytogenes TaxID=1639 RepID=UPI000D739B9E|nr:DUF1642 domain-containing protein [Listeria monocytogenes]PXE68238.1 hypothetical protein C9795_06660 [Listeria monocytogenes]PXE74546.1 hypothetical protein C9796_06655 [Listeria monocytogenes]